MGKSARYKVKGTRFYDAKVALAESALAKGSLVTLRREPENPYDRNAVGVYLSNGYRKLGHISRDSAADVGQKILTNCVDSVVVESVVDGAEVTIQIRISYKGDDRSLPHDADALSISARSLPRSCGVYKLRNIRSGRIYIGSSANIRERADRHISELRLGKHGNSVLQRDYDAFGAVAFEFSVLALASSRLEADRLEERNIDDARRKGEIFYNLTIDGKGKPTAGHWENQSPISAHPPTPSTLTCPLH